MSFLKYLILAVLMVPSAALAAYDPSTFAAPSSISQSVPYPIINYVTPQMYGAKCDGSTNDRTAFFNANAAAVSLGATLLIEKSSGECVIGSALTLTASLSFVQGAMLQPASAITVTINAPLFAGMYQIFDVSAGGLIRGAIQAQAYPIEWWGAYSDGTHSAQNTAALQAALDLAFTGNPKAHITAFGAGRDYVFATTPGITKTASGDCPQIEGLGTSPDGTNFVFSPATSLPFITFDGTGYSAAPCNGGISGVYLDGNSNNLGVELLNQSFVTVDIGASSAIGQVGLSESYGANNFAESNRIKLNVPGLNTSALAWEFKQANSGTGSFAGTVFEDGTQISLASGSRTLPIIRFDSGAFFYNGELNILLSNGTGAAVNLLENLQTADLWFSGGNVRFEGSDSSTLVFNDPLHSQVYFGGTVTTQGTVSTNLAGVTFCRTFNYTSGGQAECQGGTLYNQVVAAAGNTTIVIPLGITSQNTYSKLTGYIINADDTYEYEFAVELQVAGSGTATVTSYVLAHDSHSYGTPTFAVNGSHQLTVANSGWPSGTFTVSYISTVP